MSELVPAPGQPLTPHRPTKCTPDTIRTVTDALREGMSANGAMRLAGVDPNVLYGATGWVHRGERGEEPFATFLREATLAIGQAEQKAVRALTAGFKSDWRAAASYLARRHPESWAEKQQPQMDAGAGVDPVEQFRSEMEAMRNALRDGTDPER
jgi:hypothetical protein